MQISKDACTCDIIWVSRYALLEHKWSWYNFISIQMYLHSDIDQYGRRNDYCIWYAEIKQFAMIITICWRIRSKWLLLYIVYKTIRNDACCFFNQIWFIWWQREFYEQKDQLDSQLIRLAMNCRSKIGSIGRPICKLYVLLMIRFN